MPIRGSDSLAVEYKTLESYDMDYCIYCSVYSV